MKSTHDAPNSAWVQGILLAGALLAAPLALADADDEQALREANFKAADADGDGALNEVEFRAFIDANAEDDLGRAKTIRRFAAYDRAFGQLDEDGSGTVSWSELMDRVNQAQQ